MFIKKEFGVKVIFLTFFDLFLPWPAVTKNSGMTGGAAAPRPPKSAPDRRQFTVFFHSLQVPIAISHFLKPS